MNKMTRRSGRDQSRLINLYLLTKIIGQDVIEADAAVGNDALVDTLLEKIFFNLETVVDVLERMIDEQ